MFTTDINTPSPIALLLAAGKGERFLRSAQHQCSPLSRTTKLLQPVTNNLTIFEASLKNLSAVFERVITVVPSNPMFKDIALKYNATVVINSSPEKGMSHSLRLGVQTSLQITPEHSLVVALADMPMVLISTLQLLKQGLTRQDLSSVKGGRIAQKNRIVRPFFVAEKGQKPSNKQYGHPVGFGANFLPELKIQTGDQGARNLIQKYPENIIALPTTDQGILLDVDTHDMLQIARHRFCQACHETPVVNQCLTED